MSFKIDASSTMPQSVSRQFVSQHGDSTAPLTVRDAAALLQITPCTLKYYEERELVTPSRSKGHYRLYDEQDIERFARILRLRCLGFSPHGRSKRLTCALLTGRSKTAANVIPMNPHEYSTSGTIFQSRSTARQSTSPASRVDRSIYCHSRRGRQEDDRGRTGSPPLVPRA